MESSRNSRLYQYFYKLRSSQNIASGYVAMSDSGLSLSNDEYLPVLLSRESSVIEGEMAEPFSQENGDIPTAASKSPGEAIIAFLWLNLTL